MVGKPGSKNNQDAYHWVHGRNCSFAVVCDGCSSGKHSEVGAQLVSRALSEIVISMADLVLDDSLDAIFGNEFWQQVEQSLLEYIKETARPMGKSMSQTINDFWLCTIVSALITPLSTYVATVGDGCYSVNGQIHHLKPGVMNSPTYLAYQITGTTLQLTDPDSLKLRVHNAYDTDGINSLILASDGIDDLIKHADSNLPGKAERIGPLAQFTAERFFLNPDNVRRRLALIGLETVRDSMIVSSPLTDDTTLIVIRRHPATTNQTPTPTEQST